MIFHRIFVLFPLLLATTLSVVVSSTHGAGCSTSQHVTISEHTNFTIAINATSGTTCSELSFSAFSNVSSFLITVLDWHLNDSAELTVGDTANARALSLTKWTKSHYRQVIVGQNGRFEVRLSSSTSSTFDSSANFTVEPIGVGACPSGWRRAGALCHGRPVNNDRVTFDQAAVLCHKLRSNLAIGFDSYRDFESAVPDNEPHWVGVMEQKGRNTKIYFLTGQPFYQSLSRVPTEALYCRQSANCKCVFYKRGSFYRASCDSNFAQLCSMPIGGTTPDRYYYPSEISTYISRWSAANPSEMTLLFARYWPAFIVLFLLVFGFSVGYRIFFRMRLARRRQLPSGAIVAASVAAHPPPGSYPAQAPPTAYYPNASPMQPPGQELTHWHQPQTMEPQPPPYSYYSNASFQPDVGGVAGAAAPTEAAAPKETKT